MKKVLTAAAFLLGFSGSAYAGCSDYANQAAAQRAFDKNPRVMRNLDEDRNGIACEGSFAGAKAGSEAVSEPVQTSAIMSQRDRAPRTAADRTAPPAAPKRQTRAPKNCTSYDGFQANTFSLCGMGVAPRDGISERWFAPTK